MADAPAATPAGEFPCKLVISIPFPTARLAEIALRALQVDQELSPLVTRSFGLQPAVPAGDGDGDGTVVTMDSQTKAEGAMEVDTMSPLTVLRVVYTATTDRMLRVAVNGFFESLRLVVECMEDLDVDVVMNPSSKSLHAVQGLAEVKSQA